MIAEIQEATAAYQNAARNAIQACILYAFGSAIVGTILTVVIMKMLANFWL